MDEYQDMVESEIWRLEDLEESETTLSEENRKWLELLQGRMTALGEKDSRKQYKMRVKVMAGFSEESSPVATMSPV